MKCLRCDKDFKGRAGKKYCSKICQTRYNANKTYLRRKDDPEFKKKNYERSLLWIKNNRDRFNSLMRTRSKEYQRKMRAYSREKGLCVRCYKELPAENRKVCFKCSEKSKIWSKNSYHKKKNDLQKEQVQANVLATS